MQGSAFPSNFSVSSVSSCFVYSESDSPYQLDLVVPPFALPYTTVFEYSSSGYLSTTRIIQTGGLPLYPYIIPSTILITSSSDKVRTTFKAVSLRNIQISKFSIEIRLGYNNFTGPSEVLVFEGTEGIFSLPKNIYSIVGKADGFKTDYSEIIDKNLVVLLFTPDDFEDNEIRIVLS